MKSSGVNQTAAKKSRLMVAAGILDCKRIFIWTVLLILQRIADTPFR